MKRSSSLPGRATDPRVAVSQPSVVLIDEHALFRSGLRELLQEHAVTVLADAPSGELGLRAVSRLQPDVAVVDLGLPGISGVHVARVISTSIPNTRVLMLTLSTDTADVTDAILAGASGYLLKDAPSAEIVAGIHATALGDGLISARVVPPLLEQVRLVAPGTGERSLAQLLSPRELEILQLLTEGRENSEIAAALFVSPHTVKNHVSSVLAKLGVNNRVQAAVLAVREQLI